jgi:hypothetical protein
VRIRGILLFICALPAAAQNLIPDTVHAELAPRERVSINPGWRVTPAILRTADRAQIRADGLDLSFITVRVADRDGVNVPRANQKIRFSVTGPGEVVATDNGDPTSFESFQSRGPKF